MDILLFQNLDFICVMISNIKLVFRELVKYMVCFGYYLFCQSNMNFNK